jgi:hypothetical protein
MTAPNLQGTQKTIALTHRYSPLMSDAIPPGRNKLRPRNIGFPRPFFRRRSHEHGPQTPYSTPSMLFLVMGAQIGQVHMLITHKSVFFIVIFSIATRLALSSQIWGGLMKGEKQFGIKLTRNTSPREGGSV